VRRRVSRELRAQQGQANLLHHR